MASIWCQLSFPFGSLGCAALRGRKLTEAALIQSFFVIRPVGCVAVRNCAEWLPWRTFLAVVKTETKDLQT
jgi:hypothetical protein